MLGRWLWVGTFCLALFQIPTSVLFEDSLYESFDSASAIGGVFAVALLYTKPRREPTTKLVSNTFLLARDGQPERKILFTNEEEEFTRLVGS